MKFFEVLHRRRLSFFWSITVNAASLIVARYLVTHGGLPRSRDLVPDFDSFTRWACTDFGGAPISRRVLIEARCQLVEMTPPSSEE